METYLEVTSGVCPQPKCRKMIYRIGYFELHKCKAAAIRFGWMSDADPVQMSTGGGAGGGDVGNSASAQSMGCYFDGTHVNLQWGGGADGTCSQSKKCACLCEFDNCPDGTKLTSNLPCNCGSNACLTLGQVCTASTSTCEFPVCDVTDGTGESSNLPCKCGSSSCLAGKTVCTAGVSKCSALITSHGMYTDGTCAARNAVRHTECETVANKIGYSGQLNYINNKNVYCGCYISESGSVMSGYPSCNDAISCSSSYKCLCKFHNIIPCTTPTTGLAVPCGCGDDGATCFEKHMKCDVTKPMLDRCFYPNCNKQSGNSLNTEWCQCGSSVCSEESGFYCLKDKSVCSAAPMCTITDGSKANSGMSCGCGSVICTSASDKMYCLLSSGGQGACASAGSSGNFVTTGTCESNGMATMTSKSDCLPELLKLASCESMCEDDENCNAYVATSDSCKLHLYSGCKGEASCITMGPTTACDASGPGGTYRCNIAKAGKNVLVNDHAGGIHGVGKNYPKGCMKGRFSPYWNLNTASSKTCTNSNKCVCKLVVLSACSFTFGARKNLAACKCNSADCDANDFCIISESKCSPTSEALCVDAGTYRTPGSVGECLAMTTSTCPAGEGYSSASAQSDDDLSASTADDGECQACVQGYYKGLAGATKCLVMTTSTCPAGEGYSSVSAKSDDDLSASTADDGECEACAQGYYKGLPGAAKCTACPVGHSTRAAGKLEISDCACAPGSFADGSNNECTECGSGSAQEGYGEDSCDTCNPAQYQNEDGKDSCKACPEGWSEMNSGSKTCSQCNAGSFSNNFLSCDQCPSGQSQNEDGKNGCEDCPTGWHEATSGSLACKECLTGKSVNSKGSLSCNDCVPGKFANEKKTVDCQNCPLGFSADENATVDCKICVAGKYESQPGQRHCTDCGVGRGNAGPGRIKECEVCLNGRYSDLLSIDLCKKCPKGYHLLENKDQLDLHVDATKHDEFTDCHLCEIGFFNPFEGNMDPCYPCSSAHDKGAEVCRGCIPGKFTIVDVDDNRNITCKFCPSGWSTSGLYAQEICSGCGAGMYAEAGQPKCLTCIRGKSSAAALATSNNTCTDCIAGMYAQSEGALLCTHCKQGLYSELIGAADSAKCKICSAGKYSIVVGAGKESACQKCEAGKYGDSVAASSRDDCKSCPIGYVQPKSGAAYCLSCVPGEYVDVKGATKCKGCGRDTYTSITAATSCTECPSGKGNLGKSSSCGDCPPGTMKRHDQSCSHCLAGQFQPKAGKSFCEYCPIGFSQNEISSSACLPCVPGMIQGERGQEYCIDCEPNSFSAQSKQKDCTKCELGKYALNSGSSSCTFCSVGKFGKASGCYHCPQSWKRSDDDRELTECLQCAVGTYTLGTGSVSCLDCGVGKFGKSGQCEVCPIGWKRSDDDRDLTRCVKCVLGKYNLKEASASCTECGVGKFGIDSICERCPIGWTRADEDKDLTKCIQCAVGKYTLRTGSTSCTDCGVGKFGSDSLGLLVCKQCPTGWKRSDEDKDLTKCIQCGHNMEGNTKYWTTTTKVGATSCDKCDVGMHATGVAEPGPERGLCVPCEVGKVAEAKGAAACLPCDKGEITNEKRSLCVRPRDSSGKFLIIVGDCDPGQFLDDGLQSTKNASERRCKDCPRGGNCTNAYNYLSTLAPKSGYWKIDIELDPSDEIFFERCPYPKDCQYNQRTNESCVNGTKGILCSQCVVGFDRIGSTCDVCRNDEVQTRVLLLILFVCVTLVGVAFCRRRLQKIHRKYSVAWKDVALAVKIMISFQQINSSLPAMMDTYEWPTLYLQFLNRLGFVQLDLVSLMGLQCTVDVDYRYSMLLAFFIPIIVIMLAWLAYRNGRRMAYTQADRHMTQNDIDGIMAKLFDLADFDESEELDETEFNHLVQSVSKHHTRLSKHRLTKLMDMAGAKIVKHIEHGKVCERMMLGRAEFLQATSTIVSASTASATGQHVKTTKKHIRPKKRKKSKRRTSILGFLSSSVDEEDDHKKPISIAEYISPTLSAHWVVQHEVMSVYVSGAVQMLLLFHAPVSAKSFLYFDCHEIGSHKFLRRDYKIDCASSEYEAFLPIAVILMAGFAFAFPIWLAGYLFSHRKDLHSPKTRQTIGWYASNLSLLSLFSLLSSFADFFFLSLAFSLSLSLFSKVVRTIHPWC